MALVEQPVELAAAPPDEQHELRVEGAQGRVRSLPTLRLLDLPSLEARDASLARARPACDVGLAPAEAVPKGSSHPAETEIAHSTIVRRRRLPAA